MPTQKVGAMFGYGSFLTAAINFLIIAFALYLLIRAMNKLTATRAETRRNASADAQNKSCSQECAILSHRKA